VSTAGELVTILASVFALVTAVCTVTLKSPIRAAVALLFHIISLAVLYLTLHAELLAALQLIVYAGAVVVLFIFVIMMLGPSATTASSVRGILTRAGGASVMLIIGTGIAFQLIEVTRGPVAIPACPPGGGVECQQFGGVEGVGMALFNQAAVPFELVSVLLTVAIIGAVAVARGRTAEEVAQLKAKRAQEKQAATAALAADAASSGGQ